MSRTRLHAFLSDRRGGVAIYVALAMPVLVGGMGLGAETGYRYHNQRLLQHAADFAAHAGAVHKAKGDDKDDIDAAALDVALGSDYDGAVGTITVNIPPLSGAFTGEPTAVEVILTETRPKLFSAIFAGEDDQDVVIAARAVAAVTGLGQPACILALNETESGAVTVTGSTTATLTGCAVASNSTASDSFDMQGQGGTLTTDCVQSSGGAETTDNLTMTECEAPLTNAPAVADPYYWVMEPPACPAGGPGGGNVQIGNGGQNASLTTVTTDETWTHPDGTVLNVKKFCNGVSLKGPVHFEPGVYIIGNGDFAANNTAVVTGEDVTFYLGPLASVKFNGGAQFDLSAPEDGPYSGILFFGARSNTLSHDILGNSASSFTGAIYMPAADVEFTGNSDGSNGCTQVIADTIKLTGNSDLAIECADDGTEEILIGQIISVVE
ncbi:putative Flp pilus-assembly TadE/G-like protein [Palleronia aestuarii]|uniref:Putative Flp pilus-assembly TadE/G-like protein n=1 Tax=Palleronia aestuarii TaxID=568105 RepID=A0A2W7MZJ9_9RHOB|nr:pilus assembly protein TadG-related protein [Palleronia aestuarii]PZX13111.1 putative Flp pilus-assembly TadE/G-like protein [Palleronia aestuarii]